MIGLRGTICMSVIHLVNEVNIPINRRVNNNPIIEQELSVKGATGLYQHVGGAEASFCLISIMLHIRDPFFKIK